MDLIIKTALPLVLLRLLKIGFKAASNNKVNNVIICLTVSDGFVSFFLCKHNPEMDASVRNQVNQIKPKQPPVQWHQLDQNVIEINCSFY